MKVITVNLLKNYLKAIELLVGENGLYPSRSELIRVAIRDFLIRELQIAKGFTNIIEEEAQNPKIYNQINKKDKMFVRVPIEKNMGVNTIKEYKTYRIVRK